MSGTILGVFVYTGYYLGLVNDSTDDCNNGERVPDSALRAVYRWHALTLSFFVVIFITVTFLGVREQKGMIDLPVVHYSGTSMSNWTK